MHMKRTAYEIIVGGELPRIGSGYRLVYAATGNKWVYLTTLQGEGKTRITKNKWGKIKKRGTLPDTEITRGQRKVKTMLRTSKR